MAAWDAGVPRLELAPALGYEIVCYNIGCYCQQKFGMMFYDAFRSNVLLRKLTGSLSKIAMCRFKYNNDASIHFWEEIGVKLHSNRVFVLIHYQISSVSAYEAVATHRILFIRVVVQFLKEFIWEA